MKKTLLLGASYEVLNFINFRKTIKFICKDKVEIISEWEDEIPFGNGSIRHPSIIRLKDPPRRHYFNNNFSRKALVKRDKSVCQYCNVKLIASQITVDHVIPKSLGGATSFINCVVACQTCNNKKDNRIPEQAGMKLLKKPTLPSYSARKNNIDNPEYWSEDWDNFLNM